MLKKIKEKIRFEFPKIKLPLLQGATVEEKALDR